MVLDVYVLDTAPPIASEMKLNVQVILIAKGVRLQKFVCPLLKILMVWFVIPDQHLICAPYNVMLKSEKLYVHHLGR